jgi:Bacteriocin-protection, YdeI or OmpD-Associated/Domain of unknown function (DUF1905)
MPARPAKARRSPSFSFSARILRVGTLYAVDVPAAISRSLGVRGNVSVRVRANQGAPYHGTLLPRGDGRHRMLVNRDARGGARAGTRIAIEIRIERREREVIIPEDLETALRDEGVLAAWESLPPGKREHILRWIDEAVHEPTREKRVARAVQEALARHERNVDRGLTE